MGPPDTLEFCEVHWSFPVQRHKVTADNLLRDPEVVWVQPFSFCDCSTAVFSSREIWGANTLWAEIVHETPR